MNEISLDEKLKALEPAYQSEAERQIGRTLDQYGIPFFYRQPMLIYDQGRHQIWHPSFALPGYDGMVVDYIDSKNDQERQNILEYKLRAYEHNQIPVVLLVDTDLHQSDWKQRLYTDITKSYYG